MTLEGKKIILLRLVADDVIDGPHPRNKIPPLELKYIEALLKEMKGINVELFDQIIYKYKDTEVIDYINKVNPQIILISFTTLERHKIEKLVKSCKKDNTLFVGVGQGVAFYSDRYRDWLMGYFDLLIPGEPEIIFISCIDKILNGYNSYELRKEIWDSYLREGAYIVEDVNLLPIPKYEPLEIKNYGSIYPVRINKRLKWGYVLSSRGCPHSCIFCSPCMRKSYGHKIRYRNVSSVIDEIEELIVLGVNIISFEDDDFTYSSRQVELVCREIIERGIKINWIAHARVDEITLGLIRIMEKSGCKLLRFGIESGQEKVINCIRKGNGATWRVQTEEVFFQLKKSGIDVSAMFMVGNPKETKKDIEDTIEFSKKIKPDSIQVALFEVYPGSSLFSSLNQEDRDKILEYPSYHYRDISLNMSSLKKEELMCLHSKFYRDFILRLQYLFLHIGKFFYFI
jgi:radical SAM superfamily enzyme YgiQ (UPF0313 family)